MASTIDRTHPQQRRPRPRPAPAARARAVAAELPGLVAGHGPDGFQANDVYLRTAICVDAEGWAHFGYVKMPDYRWGIFLADPSRTADRLRRRHGRSGLAGSARRVPQCAAAAHRHPGRHGARVESSSSASSATRARRSTTCATYSRSTSRKAATCGQWCTCCTRTSGATGARRPKGCCSADPGSRRAAHLQHVQRADRIGSRSSCSRCSPTATEPTRNPHSRPIPRP